MLGMKTKCSVYVAKKSYKPTVVEQSKSPFLKTREIILGEPYIIEFSLMNKSRDPWTWCRVLDCNYHFVTFMRLHRIKKTFSFFCNLK